jgi:predicted phage baseplate assembly protein
VTLDFTIDRATFRTLVDTALRRIPTASRGRWTLHAPVDPGIALVELFAWLLEQRSYWADQTTEPLVAAVLVLLGEQLRTARPAGVAMTFAPEDTDDPGRWYAPHALISARTALRVPETDLVFTVSHAMLALAVVRYGDAPRSPVIHVAGDLPASAEEDLRSGRAIDLLPASGGPAGTELGFALKAPPPSGPSAPASILFELDSSVEPAWSPDAAPARPPATLRWEYRTTAGAWRPLPQLRDGTLGLRRSGTVRFALPADWSAYGADHVGWIRIATDAATFSAPPSAIAIVPNTALATHVQWHCHIDSPNWVPLPGRTIQLDPGAPPLADRTVVYVTELDGRHRWHVVPDFTDAGPADRVVVVDRTRARVRFGDGLNGRVPRAVPDAVPQVCVLYAAGGGDAGNVAPCAWQALSGPLPGALTVVAARGGRDDETAADARFRVAAGLVAPTRAVTPGDHERIAIATPGVAVARAHAEPGFQRGECGVVPGVTTVFVVPGIHSRTRDAVRANTAVPAPAADPGLLDEVRAQFARTRLAGELIHVERAAYRQVRLRAKVAGAPHDPEGLRRRLAAALRLYLDPLLGGDDQEGWPFGEPVRPTALLGVAQREVGDRGEVVEVAIAIDDRPYEACEDVAIRSYELVAVAAIDVVIDAAPAAEVGLR